MQITIKNVSKCYAAIKALDNVCLNMTSGEVVGLLGRNGAGKSTLIKCIVGILSPDEGKILLDGCPVLKSDVKIGYLPEERGLYLNTTVKDQLCYFAFLNGMGRMDAEKALDDYLDMFEIGDLKNRKIKSLSKGNKQKIQLIGAVLHNPDLIIMDEPFSGLDPINGMMFKKVIAELRSDGKIIVISSHQMDGIEELCNRVVMIKHGVIIQNDTMKNIIEEFSRYDEVHLEVNDIKAAEQVIIALGISFRIQKNSFVISTKNSNNLFRLQEELTSRRILMTSLSEKRASMQEIFVEELK